MSSAGAWKPTVWRMVDVSIFVAGAAAMAGDDEQGEGGQEWGAQGEEETIDGLCVRGPLAPQA